MKRQAIIENKEEIQKEIEERIGEKRMKHSLRVADMARDLAIKYGEDPEKAYIAGYYHDCMKIRDKDQLKKAAKDYGLEWTEDFDRAPQLVHSFLGAKVAEKRYGIKDPEILSAMAYHTTGKPSMTGLEKIIYLADYGEPMRNFKGVDQARDLIFKDLDAAMLYALNQTIRFLLDKESYITPLSVQARNDFLIKEKTHGQVF